MAKILAIAVPILLGVLGAIAAFSPAIAQSKFRQWWVALFIVVGFAGGWATYIDSQNLEAIITGGDNYCFIVPAADHFGPDGRVPLAMVNRGKGAVIQIRYWMYESAVPVGPDDPAYQRGVAAGPLPWSNPKSSYRLGSHVPEGQYIAEIEALNGLVIEHLEIAPNGVGLKYAVALTRGGRQFYRRNFDGSEEW